MTTGMYRNGGVPQRRVFVSNGVDYGLPIQFSDSPAIDAFGRLRVSMPETLLQSQLNLSAQPLFWENALTGNGTATHLPNEAAIRMRCTSTSGDKVIRQSKQYVPYQPGKSQQILITFVAGAAKANVRKRIGYFDARNGIFLEQTSAGLSIVRRTYVTGSADDTASIPQSSWNIDPMNGNGASGINLNFSNSQILMIDLEWLGVGRVRVGFVVNGLIFYAHEFLNTNSLTTVYMSTGSLPVRYEIENTAGTTGNTDLMAICAAVASEGGQNIRAPIMAVSNGAALRQVTNTILPILSIQAGAVFPAGGSIVNRGSVYPLNISIFSEDAPIYYQVLYNATLTGASFTNYDTTHSGVQYDISASGVSGGLLIDAGYVSTTASVRGQVTNPLESNLVLTQNIAGNSGDILTVAAVRIGNTSSDCSAVIQWKEIY